ncbi:hypothetical protein H4217_005520 [Coemansia sp. RSA 1939]|nr:hypothetical protein H4217_005520 [Coemansia sp. RSA 1939]KAJ2607913.1 hypothetical protein EV177_005254 [Coemansia sp. RSA 1804]KAJ2692840.1 hypothetical protein GGH99_001477 [Coemansia sp. RSA 1285]
MRFTVASVVAVLGFGIASGVAATGPNVVGYYSSWKQQETVGVDFSKYTHINLAFGIPAQDGRSISFDPTLSLPNIVGQIHGNGTKALVSIGGWSDSTYFSTLVKNTSAGNPFIASIVSFVESNDLDGIDIDWEYPGREGNDGNVIDKANDTPNYLKFVTNLRAAFTTKFGSGKKLITMAVRVQPFDVNGSPSTDVSGFAKVVDFANLMQYDINGAWMEITGPNAPLNFEQGKATPLSFVSAIDAWTGAGWPAAQLNVGLAFYGRATNALVDMSKSLGNQYQPQELGVLPVCGGETDGVWQWKHLRDQGVLTSTGQAASPWVRAWDDTTKTPWLFNPNIKQFVSYDDPQSIAAKIDYAKSKSIGGAMVWSMYMDYKGELLDTIHTSWNGATSSSGGSGDGSGYSAAPVVVETSTVQEEVSTVTPDEYVASSETTDVAVSYPPAASYPPAITTAEDAEVSVTEEETTTEVPIPTATADTEILSVTDTEIPSATDTDIISATDTNIISATDTDIISATDTDVISTTDTEETSSADDEPSSSPASDCSSTSAGSPAQGAPCSVELKYVCDSEGTSSTYYVCLYGSWLKLSCGAGTACYQRSNFISCSWPSTSLSA